MKKRFVTIVAGICAMALLGGCAGSKGALSNDNITIKKYKGLEVDKVETIAVTDEDVEMSIQSDLETLATKTDIKDRPAQLGDIAIIDFEGKKDGVAFEGGAGTDYELELGSGQFIDGFEDGVVGHNIGETFDLDLTFPENYSSEELAGQAVVFTVTLKGLQEKHVPELTVDILAQLESKATTIEEYRAQIRSDLKVSNQETAESTLLSSVWETLVKNCEIKKFPEGMLDEYVKNLEEQYSYYAQMYGMEIEEFFKQIFGMSAKEVAKTTATQELAMALIAEKEGLTIKDKDYEAGVKDLASQYGYEDTEEFLKAYGEDSIRKALLQEKVGKFLVDNCVQVEPKEEKEK
ncbi:MAG: trigger factor [Tyzzerella sp.]|nr:trigger factor [Tyzzerella sp.]